MSASGIRLLLVRLLAAETEHHKADLVWEIATITLGGPHRSVASMEAGAKMLVKVLPEDSRAILLAVLTAAKENCT